MSWQVVQRLTRMVGRNVKLYDMVLQFLRTLFLRTRNVHYCTLRAELLMSLHDLDVGDICSVDPCHKVGTAPPSLLSPSASLSPPLGCGSALAPVPPLPTRLGDRDVPWTSDPEPAAPRPLRFFRGLWPSPAPEPSGAAHWRALCSATGLSALPLSWHRCRAAPDGVPSRGLRSTVGALEEPISEQNAHFAFSCTTWPVGMWALGPVSSVLSHSWGRATPRRLEVGVPTFAQGSGKLRRPVLPGGCGLWPSPDHASSPQFTWCLDACIRERFVDSKRARELQGFLDGVKKGQEQVLG